MGVQSSFTSDRFKSLSIQEWSELQQIIEQFDDAWQQGRQPEIDDFLGVGAGRRCQLLVQLALLDLEHRLKSNCSLRVEQYFERYPELASSSEVALELIAAEFEARCRGQPVPAIEEYLERFPQHRLQLLALLRVPSPCGERLLARMKCPRCGTSVELRPEKSPRLCPACGGKLDESSEQRPRQVPADRAQIGRYEVLEPIGAGAFGEVYRCRDPELDRIVAVKLPRPRGPQSAELRERIIREARRAAQLQHPGIVAVYDIGQKGDQWYIVTEFVDGMTLAQRTSQGRIAHAEAALLVARVADALHYAHLQGLVHRDLKPGNILLDRAGLPHITDFGLALWEDELLREGGSLVGTPPYMAPEQVRGEGHRIDARTDVYSLGVVLYELLCGRRPFVADSTDELFEQIRERDPRPPRTVDDSIAVELERICLMAMSKRITERFTTAKDMADELRTGLSQRQLLAGRTFSGPGPSSGFRALPGEAPGSAATEPAASASREDARVLPKGLRPFGPEDAEFFLKLLPGPRDRHGLPDSIRFWKTRIESTDAHGTFEVGLIYGPSGCGKSSLARAGLLPRLAPSILQVYVEATRQGTEAQLAMSLRRVYPALDAELPLAQMVAALRRAQGIRRDQKVLIVFDQFEQWLHTRAQKEESNELIAAFRQADGEHVQFLLLVRDDFWSATNRLFQQLEINMVEDRNVRLVDLFDQQHARAVLEQFGAAYGQLPPSAAELNSDQKRFLAQAVNDLSQDGMVIPVRLSLFAHLMRGRPWTIASLAEVGGTEGVGVKFLQETFTARSAVPAHRALEKSARALLQALLPEHGTDIKGQMRSGSELAAACELPESSDRFIQLIDVLDRELHIITPTEAAHSGSAVLHQDRLGQESVVPGVGVPGFFYQLTHDYLIPSLREWLTQQRRRTWQGRAQLRLQELAAQWGIYRESRFLPSPTEYVSIVLGTSKSKRNIQQRALLTAAGRRYGTLAAVLLVLGCFLLWGLWWTLGSSRSRGLVQAITTADIKEVPRLINDVRGYRRWAEPELKSIVASSDASGGPVLQPRLLRARLALLPIDPGQVQPLTDSLLECSTEEFPVILQMLDPHADILAARLSPILHDRQQSEKTRFRAGIALARFAPDGSFWTKEDFESLTEQLLKSNPDEQKQLRENLQGIRGELIHPLRALFHRPSLGQSTSAALADFARDEPDILSELVSEANAEQYATIFDAIRQLAHQERVKERLGQLARGKPSLEMTEENRVELGRRRAGAAIALVRLGHHAVALDYIGEQDDPEFLTQFVHRLKARGVQPDVLIDPLLAQDRPNTATIFGLLMALGEFEWHELPTTKCGLLKERLQHLLLSHPDPGVHSAVEWLGHKWEWESPVAGPVPGDRMWYTGPNGHTFAVLSGGAAFSMGSPDNEVGRDPDEVRHTVEITHSFAVATKKTTSEQFKPFLSEIGKSLNNQTPVPSSGPANSVTWYQAAMYCRWLSEQDGIPTDQMCYPTVEQIQELAENALPLPERDFSTLSGYRLPTEKEWEWAARARSTTRCYFGQDVTLLGHYAWQGENSGKITHAVAELRPNRFGLFDVLGNVWEWCDEIYRPYPGAESGASTAPLSIRRVLRGGGSYLTMPGLVRTADRNDFDHNGQSPTVGFRVARTVMPKESH